MTLKEILKSIYEGLSGDPLSDLRYLKELTETYKGHKYEKEILIELSHIFSRITSMDEHLPFEEIGMYEAIEEVLNCMEHHSLNDALLLMENLVQKFEEAHLYEDEEFVSYHCFKEPIEEMLYVTLIDANKKIINTSEDYSLMYKMYGDLLFELQNYEEAQQAFLKALRFNPFDFEIRSEYIRTFNHLNEDETFYEKSIEALQYAYRNDEISHLFLNMAFYYLTEEKWDIANALIQCSLSFDKDNDNTKELLRQMQQQERVIHLTQEEIMSLFTKYHIPSAPNRKIIGALYSYVKKYRHEDEDIAYYICKILYDLTHFKEIKVIMDEIQEEDRVDIDVLDETSLKENDEILQALLRRYVRESTDENLYDLLHVCNKVEVIVPTFLEDLGYEEVMRPNLLRNNEGKLFYPVFTSVEEMAKGNTSGLSRTHVYFKDCIEAARRCEEEVSGIVINAFSTSVQFSFAQLEILEKSNAHTLN